MDARSVVLESSLMANLVSVTPVLNICWVKPFVTFPASVI